MNVYLLIFSRPPIKPERKIQTVSYRVHADNDRSAEVYVRGIYPGLAGYTAKSKVLAMVSEHQIIR